jgi:sugar phosphate isomerase/epimerase
MKNELRNCMRIGIVQFMAYPSTLVGSGPILESIDELARDDFFDVVELTHIEDSSIRKEAAHRIRVAGMDLAFGSQPLVLSKKLNLHSRDEALRRRSLETILAALEEAVEMGAVGFATMSGPDPGEPHRKEETSIFIDSLDRICERAKHLHPDLRVVVESFDRAPFGKNCLTGPTSEAVELAQTVQERHSNFGLMLDLSHLPLLGETSEEAVPIAAPVLAHAHIGNCVMRDSANPYYGDNHPPFGYEGGENGLDELTRYLRCLRDVGFLNEENPPIVTAEVKPLNNSLIPATLGNIKRFINRAIEKLRECND